MRTIKMYCPPGTSGILPPFLIPLDEKLRRKLLWQLWRLSHIPLCELKEPHFKHFALEKYRLLYELREKSRLLVRVIFTIQNEEVVLLVPFIKRRSRDVMRALDQSLKMLADIRECPEYAVEFHFNEEETG